MSRSSCRSSPPTPAAKAEGHEEPAAFLPPESITEVQEQPSEAGLDAGTREFSEAGRELDEAQ